MYYCSTYAELYSMTVIQSFDLQYDGNVVEYVNYTVDSTCTVLNVELYVVTGRAIGTGN